MWRSNSASSRVAAHSASVRQQHYLPKHHEIDLEKTFHAMEIGHRVCKLMLLKRWDPTYQKLYYNRETRQLMLKKLDAAGKCCSKAQTLDLRLVKEVQTLDFKLNTVKILDKWSKDKELKQFDMCKILVIAYGNAFVLNHWILLFDAADACRMWCQGIHYVMMDTVSACHSLIIERWLRKEFYNLMDANTQCVAMKHMKPFVQTSLQFKVQSKQLQEIIEEEMNYDAFAVAYRKLIHLHFLFTDLFSAYSDDNVKVSFSNFMRFLKDMQNDELGTHRERTSDFLRCYLRELDASRDIPEPSLSVLEFCDFLFSRENSVWDSINERVIHDMNQPLSHYWIASSHNTYLTGDQLKSESSLEAYAKALLMGCRCIELDCWDGQKRGYGDVLEIVIYHGYTMTSKLNLRDVLYTIRHYAFINSEYPVILSIEDNCSVPAQRLLAQEIKEILGDLLLTAPVSREETTLPSPAALKRKIILKHKKLPIESEDIVPLQNDDDDHDLLSKECVKRGILYLKSNATHEWTKHVFVLFSDRLCYMLEQCETTDSSENLLAREDSIGIGSGGDDESISDDTSSLIGFGVRPEELHVTEEWFHGKTDRDTARARLMEHQNKGNGLFLVRDSTIFIGDFSLSFLHDGQVHHCRIRTRMVHGEKKYYFLETKQMDTLYELISYYTKEKLKTPKFSTTLVTPCPQPCPHLSMPWFSEKADKKRAEELLNTVREDGAFLIRYSGTDPNVFVLSLRVDAEFWHYRLKRDGRIFVVNQTVFENLNQIVEFYSTHDFVRGICLKYPVNERNVGKYTNTANATPGCYVELRDLEKDKEILVRAIESFTASQQNEISFPVNAVITVLRKNGVRWRGKYGAQIGFFPARCVTEIEFSDGCLNDTLNYATIELAGSLIAKVPVGETDRPFAFKICQAAAHWNVTEYVMAANSNDDREDWMNTLHELTRTATDRIHILRTREKNLRIASELSNLVVYCQAVPFNSQFATQCSFYEMCSFSETKYDKLIERGLVQFNTRQLSRVYPQASRVTSTNYDPMPMWNSACHMVALNYQTGDRAMQLNQGKFMANGQCGYVLKPAYMIEDMFSPNDANTISTSCPITLSIEVIAGRHLSRKDKNKGICSPLVEIEVVGLPLDSTTARTRAIASNGLNPVWNESFSFKVRCPELALLRFYVEDGDFVGPKTDPFIGQAVYPLDCVRTGYRSVILRNQFSEELELSALLIHIEMRRDNVNAELLSPHCALQAGRTVMAASHKTSISQSSGIFSARLNSIDQSSFATTSSCSSTPLMSSSSSLNTRQCLSSPNSFDANDGVLPVPTRRTSALRKIFRFGKS